jgi:exodeoxyribonuclease V beta subunit
MGEASSTLREGREQLGGAYSLFLRGMPSAGVYFSRPADGLLDALDNLFAEGK